MVTEENLTFLVQGPIKVIDSVNLTEICINSIKKYFPKSKIIFSTDYGADVHKLNIDEVVFSKAKIEALIENDENGHLMSVNYQISSTKAGLNKVEVDKIHSFYDFKIVLGNITAIYNNYKYYLVDNYSTDNLKILSGGINLLNLLLIFSSVGFIKSFIIK